MTFVYKRPKVARPRQVETKQIFPFLHQASVEDFISVLDALWDPTRCRSSESSPQVFTRHPEAHH